MKDIPGMHDSRLPEFILNSGTRFINYSGISNVNEILKTYRMKIINETPKTADLALFNFNENVFVIWPSPINPPYPRTGRIRKTTEQSPSVDGVLEKDRSVNGRTTRVLGGKNYRRDFAFALFDNFEEKNNCEKRLTPTTTLSLIDVKIYLKETRNDAQLCASVVPKGKF